MGNLFGRLFRIMTYGESHGAGIGVVIDGCPAGVPVNEDIIYKQLAKRRPGQSKIATPRDEEDYPTITSGVFEGRSTGTPIHIHIPNKDARSTDYSHIKDSFRPSHADYTYTAKYGMRDYRGGGRSSARETAARVAAGAVALELLNMQGVQVQSWVSQVGHIKMEQVPAAVQEDAIEGNLVRCPDPTVASAMLQLIEEVKAAGDSVGGVITCQITGVPAGWGEPVFDKLHAELGKSMLSINAVKGFEVGEGFAAAAMRGSQHNDLFVLKNDKISTETNHSGGIQGGISNGEDILFRVAFKPVATILQGQKTVNAAMEEDYLPGRGRHDPCVVPRAVPIVTAMAALVLADAYLLQLRNQAGA